MRTRHCLCESGVSKQINTKGHVQHLSVWVKSVSLLRTLFMKATYVWLSTGYLNNLTSKLRSLIASFWSAIIWCRSSTAGAAEASGDEGRLAGTFSHLEAFGVHEEVPMRCKPATAARGLLLLRPVSCSKLSSAEDSSMNPLCMSCWMKACLCTGKQAGFAARCCLSRLGMLRCVVSGYCLGRGLADPATRKQEQSVNYKIADMTPDTGRRMHSTVHVLQYRFKNNDNLLLA